MTLATVESPFSVHVVNPRAHAAVVFDAPSEAVSSLLVTVTNGLQDFVLGREGRLELSCDDFVPPSAAARLEVTAALGSVVDGLTVSRVGAGARFAIAVTEPRTWAIEQPLVIAIEGLRYAAPIEKSRSQQVIFTWSNLPLARAAGRKSRKVDVQARSDTSVEPLRLSARWALDPVTAHLPRVFIATRDQADPYQNALRFFVRNTGFAPISLPAHARVWVWFATAEPDAPGPHDALTTPQLAREVVLEHAGPWARVNDGKPDPDTLRWELRPGPGVLEPQAQVELVLRNVKCPLPVGVATVYVEYEGLAGYPGAYAALEVERVVEPGAIETFEVVPERASYPLREPVQLRWRARGRGATDGLTLESSRDGETFLSQKVTGPRGAHDLVVLDDRRYTLRLEDPERSAVPTQKRALTVTPFTLSAVYFATADAIWFCDRKGALQPVVKNIDGKALRDLVVSAGAAEGLRVVRWAIDDGSSNAYQCDHAFELFPVLRTSTIRLAAPPLSIAARPDGKGALYYLLAGGQVVDASGRVERLPERFGPMRTIRPGLPHTHLRYLVGGESGLRSVVYANGPLDLIDPSFFGSDPPADPTNGGRPAWDFELGTFEGVTGYRLVPLEVTSFALDPMSARLVWVGGYGSKYPPGEPVLPPAVRSRSLDVNNGLRPARHQRVIIEFLEHPEDRRAAVGFAALDGPAAVSVPAPGQAYVIGRLLDGKPVLCRVPDSGPLVPVLRLPDDALTHVVACVA
jgi:hypothetical protein